MHAPTWQSSEGLPFGGVIENPCLGIAPSNMAKPWPLNQRNKIQAPEIKVKTSARSLTITLLQEDIGILQNSEQTRDQVFASYSAPKMGANLAWGTHI